MLLVPPPPQKKKNEINKIITISINPNLSILGLHPLYVDQIWYLCT